MSDQLGTGPGRNGPDDDDLARRFLALAARFSLPGQGDWNQAMLAELGQVGGRVVRWRFALGAARVVLIPPRSRLAAVVLAVSALAAAVAIRLLVPNFGLAGAIALPGLPAVFVWMALAWPYSQSRPSGTGRAAQVIAVAAIAAGPVLALRLLTLYPGQARDDGVATAIMTVVFSAELGGYLLAVLRRPGLLGSGQHSGIFGLAAAAATGVVFLLSQPPGGSSDSPTVSAAVVLTAFGAPLAAGVTGAVAGLMRRDRIRPLVRRAAGEMVWAVLLTGPVVLIALLLTTTHGAIATEALQPSIRGEALQQGATSVLAWVAGDDLGGAMVIFTVLSFFGVLAVAIFEAIFGLGLPDRVPDA